MLCNAKVVTLDIILYALTSTAFSVCVLCNAKDKTSTVFSVSILYNAKDYSSNIRTFLSVLHLTFQLYAHEIPLMSCRWSWLSLCTSITSHL
jgi:hypothetical protein